MAGRRALWVLIISQRIRLVARTLRADTRHGVTLLNAIGLAHSTINVFDQNVMTNGKSLTSIRDIYRTPTDVCAGWISKSEIWTKGENTGGGNFFRFQNTPRPTRTKRMDGEREKNGPGISPTTSPPPIHYNPSFCLLPGHDLIFFPSFVFPDTLEFENYRPTRSLPIDFRWRHKRLFCFRRVSKHAPRARSYRVKKDFVTRFPLRRSSLPRRGPTTKGSSVRVCECKQQMLEYAILRYRRN